MYIRGLLQLALQSSRSVFKFLENTNMELYKQGGTQVEHHSSGDQFRLFLFALVKIKCAISCEKIN